MRNQRVKGPGHHGRARVIAGRSREWPTGGVVWRGRRAGLYGGLVGRGDGRGCRAGLYGEAVGRVVGRGGRTREARPGRTAGAGSAGAGGCPRGPGVAGRAVESRRAGDGRAGDRRARDDRAGGRPAGRQASGRWRVARKSDRPFQPHRTVRNGATVRNPGRIGRRLLENPAITGKSGGHLRVVSRGQRQQRPNQVETATATDQSRY
jgi:hypothetical protein